MQCKCLQHWAYISHLAYISNTCHCSELKCNIHHKIIILQAKMCTNENSARLNKPMKQKKTKNSNTCTLSVYRDLDELRLWSVVFIIHLVVASERGKNHFFRLLLFQKPRNNTQDNVYICTKLLLWITKKKTNLEYYANHKKKVYLHIQLIYNQPIKYKL